LPTVSDFRLWSRNQPLPFQRTTEVYLIRIGPQDFASFVSFRPLATPRPLIKRRFLPIGAHRETDNVAPMQTNSLSSPCRAYEVSACDVFPLTPSFSSSMRTNRQPRTVRRQRRLYFLLVTRRRRGRHKRFSLPQLFRLVPHFLFPIDCAALVALRNVST